MRGLELDDLTTGVDEIGPLEKKIGTNFKVPPVQRVVVVLVSR